MLQKYMYATVQVIGGGVKVHGSYTGPQTQFASCISAPLHLRRPQMTTRRIRSAEGMRIASHAVGILSFFIS